MGRLVNTIMPCLLTLTHSLTPSLTLLIQAFFKWFERKIKSNLRAAHDINKETLIDEILELLIFTKRAEAAKFVNTMQILADGSLSLSHFVTALSGVLHSEDVRTLKKFAHSIIRSEKKYEKKEAQQNQLAAAAMRRKQLESTSTHVAIKQTKIDSKYSTAKHHLKGGGTMFTCSGPAIPHTTVTDKEKMSNSSKDNKDHDAELEKQDTLEVTTSSTEEKSKLAILIAMDRVASIRDMSGMDMEALPESVTNIDIDTSAPDDIDLDILPQSPLLSPHLSSRRGSISFSPKKTPRTPGSSSTSASLLSLQESPSKDSTPPPRQLFRSHSDHHQDSSSSSSTPHSPLTPTSSLNSPTNSSTCSNSNTHQDVVPVTLQLPGLQKIGRSPNKHLRRQSSNI
jgi:hypothetical protein